MYEEQLNDPGAVQVEQRTAPPYESAIVRASLLEEMIYEGMRDGVWSYYMSLHPSDRAAVLTELPGGIRRSLAHEMQPETFAGLLDYLEPRISARILRDFSPEELADILDLTDPATSTEILGRLPSGKRLDTIEAMETSNPVEALLRYEEDSIGRLIAPLTSVLTEDTTVPIALDRLRLMGPAAEETKSLLVVNDYGFLVGSLNPVRLALARPSATVGQIMDRDITSVTTSMEEQVAVQIMSQLRVSELPVVEEDGRLVGVVRAEDAVEVVEDIATEDMYRMAGIGEERITGPVG